MKVSHCSAMNLKVGRNSHKLTLDFNHFLTLIKKSDSKDDLTKALLSERIKPI